MTLITTEKLSDTAGAHVVGVDRERPLDDEAHPTRTLDALEENGALVFRDRHIDDATSPQRVYRHTWEVGDLVIWDNRGVLHWACPYDPTSARDLHRTTLDGDEPVQ